MIIGPSYVYIALPRTASQSMCAWLQEHHHGRLWPHLYHSALVPYGFRSRFVFTIVRDPYERMMSLYRLLVQKFWAEADEQVAETVGMTPAQFVRWCIGRPQPQWKSQHEILSHWTGAIVALRFERLPGCLQSLPFGGGKFPHIDKTERDQKVGADFIDAVNEHSRDDFAQFGYERRTT